MENRCHNKKNIGCYDYEITVMCQGAKKISFTACPKGKLSLTSTSLKIFFREQNEKILINYSFPNYTVS